MTMVAAKLERELHDTNWLPRDKKINFLIASRYTPTYDHKGREDSNIPMHKDDEFGHAYELVISISGGADAIFRWIDGMGS